MKVEATREYTTTGVSLDLTVDEARFLRSLMGNSCATQDRLKVRDSLDPMKHLSDSEIEQIHTDFYRNLERLVGIHSKF